MRIILFSWGMWLAGFCVAVGLVGCDEIKSPEQFEQRYNQKLAERNKREPEKADKPRPAYRPVSAPALPEPLAPAPFQIEWVNNNWNGITLCLIAGTNGERVLYIREGSQGGAAVLLTTPSKRNDN